MNDDLKRHVSMAIAIGLALAPTSARAGSCEAAGEGEQGGEETEIEVPPHAVPASAWDALKRAAGDGTIEKIELEQEEGLTVYEADVAMPGGDRYEIEVDPDGKLIEMELERE